MIFFGRTWPQAEQAQRLPDADHIFCEPGLIIALNGHPIWRPAGPVADQEDPARQLALAYRRWGAEFLSRLHGSFALAIIDQQSQTAVLAVDRMGIERLAYARHGEELVFSSSAQRVAECVGSGSALRRQALYDFLLHHMVPAPATVYAGVDKLRAGYCAIFKNGRLDVRRYWQPAFREQLAGTQDQLGEELRAALRVAVTRCQPDAATGAFLSGGLDSSSVAGMLGVVNNKPARTFSMGFGENDYNELEFAHVAARHFGFDATEYQVTPDDIVSSIPQIARAYDEPFGNSSAVPTYLCAQLAKRHGVAHLLAGDGGDEIFGGNERYARQPVFEMYRRAPAALRRFLIEPLANRIDSEHAIAVLRKLRSYVDQARISLPERLECWNYMYRADLDAMLDPEFRASVDPRAPFKAMASVYESVGEASLLNKMLAYDWQRTLADNDLRKVGTMCDLAGVKVSYPLLDPDIVELSLRVPSNVKMHNNELRTFYKHAMREFLPAEILSKPKHGFGLPFGVWMKTHKPLADTVFGFLSALKTRRIVRPQFIDRLIAEQRGGDPGYFGYAVWDLTLLEAWLQAHAKSVA